MKSHGFYRSLTWYSPILLSLFLLLSCNQDNTLQSPNGKIRVSINKKTQLADDENHYLTVEYLGENTTSGIVQETKLGLLTESQNFSKNLKLISISERKHIVDNYPMITGKKSQCKNEAYEKTYTFENEEKQTIDIILRAYNDGVAFKYNVTSPLEIDYITNELTTYFIPDGTNRWIQPYEVGYEDFYPLANNGATIEGKTPGLWGYPALLEKQDSIFILITEANIQRGHCASQLNNEQSTTEYKVKLNDERIPFNSSWTSPWRVLIIGSLADIVESTLVTDVSDPNTFGDVDWITPGLVSWIYWANNRGSQNFQIVKEYIDLAVEMKWPYNLIDWEWDVMRNGGNVDDAIKYSLEKGVKPMLWYNSGTSWIGPGAPGPLDRLNTKKNREKEYEQLKKSGVEGIKIDFFKGDDAASMNYYIDLLEDAMKYKLLINFHGATIPRGWQRTYPNLMTIEGVYGAEWYNNSPVLTPKAASHNATLPFTRNVIGSMDYTPGTFSDSQHPHITSHGHELALYVVFESALQHMPDRPSSYLSLPAPVREFLSGLPTTWDETKLISGYPGVEVVIARRKGDVWYIGGLNGTDESKTFFLTDILAQNSGKKITLFKDGQDDRSFAIEDEIITTNPNPELKIECLPRGGFVAVIK